jgi:hypothetical protein
MMTQEFPREDGPSRQVMSDRSHIPNFSFWLTVVRIFQLVIYYRQEGYMNNFTNFRVALGTDNLDSHCICCHCVWDILCTFCLSI